MKSKRLLSHALVAILAAASSVAQTAPTAIAPIVEKGKDKEAPLSLPTFEVRSDKDEGYLSTQTTSGSRTVEMLRDVPATISVMNRQLMDDLNVTTVDELSQYAVTGHISDDTQGTNAVYIFRGLNTDAYRDKTYRGNFDFNRDGVAEMAYTPAYFLANFTAGYRTRLFSRPTTFNLNVNNVFDKTYFRSRSIGAGSWGEPRNFRFAIRTEL